MEIVVYPRSFGVAPSKSPTQQGGTIDTMTVMVQDVNGTIVKLIFGAEQDWKGFQAFVADHEQATKTAAARALILSGAKTSPTLRERKH